MRPLGGVGRRVRQAGTLSESAVGEVDHRGDDGANHRHHADEKHGKFHRESFLRRRKGVPDATPVRLLLSRFCRMLEKSCQLAEELTTSHMCAT